MWNCTASGQRQTPGGVQVWNMTGTACFQGKPHTDDPNSGLATDISHASASMLSLGKSDQFFRRKEKQSKLAQDVTQCKARDGRTNEKSTLHSI